jgi:hypothetical protein
MHDRDGVGGAERARRRPHAQCCAGLRGHLQPAARQENLCRGRSLRLARAPGADGEQAGRTDEVNDLAGRQLDLHLGALGCIDEIAVLHAGTFGELVPCGSPQHAHAAVEDRDHADIGAVAHGRREEETKSGQPSRLHADAPRDAKLLIAREFDTRPGRAPLST